jgi:hypothetical protein
MTPKEKATELYETYLKLGKDFTRGVSMHEFSKQCVLASAKSTLHSIHAIYDDCISRTPAPYLNNEDTYASTKGMGKFWEDVIEETHKL